MPMQENMLYELSMLLVYSRIDCNQGEHMETEAINLNLRNHYPTWQGPGVEGRQQLLNECSRLINFKSHLPPNRLETLIK